MIHKSSNQTQSQLLICYDNQQLITYINKQIQQLEGISQVRCVRRFAIINLQVPNITNTYSYTSDNHHLQFIIILGKNYPLAAPRIHIKNNLLKPGINDCRDLLQSILGLDQWDYRITLKQIQQRITKYLTFLYKQKQKQQNKQIYYIARLGNFQLNSIYPIQIINQLRQDNIFYAFQMLNDGDFKMCILDVSTTHLTIFTTKQQPYYQKQGFKIPAEKDITLCMMIFYAQLGSISDIYIDRNNCSDIHITFISQKPHNMTLQTRQKTKKFKIKKGINFIHKLLKNRKYYNLGQTTLKLSQQTITIQQSQLLEQITKKQNQIKHHLNIQTVKQLVDCYQAIIQYYSSNNIPYYQIYLEYITRLYQRQDVRMVMGTDLPDLGKKNSGEFGH